MNLHSGRVMSGLPRAVIEVARSMGHDLADVLAAHGTDMSTLDRADAYVPVELHEALWCEGSRRTGQSNFGMYAAQRFTPGLTGVVEYLLRNCSSIREGAQAWLEWASLVSDCISGALEEYGEEVHLYWRLSRPDSPGTRQWAEFAQGRTLVMIREALGVPDLAPAQVWFRHGAPEDVSAHTELFRAPIRFNQAEHALIWSKDWLERPLKGVDHNVRRALQSRAENLRQEIDASPMHQDCARTIRDLLGTPDADARLERVAEYLDISPRTLQRKLKAEGSSFQKVLDGVRRSEAERLLVNLPHAQVALRLGFNDAAALRKAQRRWALSGSVQTSESGDR